MQLALELGCKTIISGAYWCNAVINVWSKSVRGKRGEQRRGRTLPNSPSVFAVGIPKHISGFPIHGGPRQQRQHWHMPSSKQSTKGMQIQPDCGGFLDFDSLTVKFRNKPGSWGAGEVWVSSSSEGSELPDGSRVRMGRWLILSSNAHLAVLNYRWTPGNAGRSALLA